MELIQEKIRELVNLLIRSKYPKLDKEKLLYKFSDDEEIYKAFYELLAKMIEFERDNVKFKVSGKRKN